MFQNDIPVAEQIKLLGVPPPTVIATPEFQAVYDEVWAKFIELDPKYKYRLESDPVVKIIEAWAYERMLLESRINYSARQTLLAFAKGSVLDHLGANHGVTRIEVSPANNAVNPPKLAVMESDARLRDRIQLAIAGASMRGGREFYRYHALTADPRVLDAIVFSPDSDNGFNMGGRVAVCILSNESGFVASSDLLNIVTTYLNQSHIAMLSDVLVVSSAAPKSINFDIAIKLERIASRTVFDTLENNLKQAFVSLQMLGRDVTHAWINSVLYVQGVHSITINQPTSDAVVEFNEFPVLGTVNVVFAGYADQDGFNTSAVGVSAAYQTGHIKYRDYCISMHRTKDQIISDLQYLPRPGLVETTCVSFAEFVGLSALIKKTSGEYISKDDMCFLIWKKLSLNYV